MQKVNEGLPVKCFAIEGSRKKVGGVSGVRRLKQVVYLDTLTGSQIFAEHL